MQTFTVDINPAMFQRDGVAPDVVVDNPRRPAISQTEKYYEKIEAEGLERPQHRLPRMFPDGRSISPPPRPEPIPEGATITTSISTGGGPPSNWEFTPHERTKWKRIKEVPRSKSSAPKNPYATSAEANRAAMGLNQEGSQDGSHQSAPVRIQDMDKKPAAKASRSRSSWANQDLKETIRRMDETCSVADSIETV